MNKDGDITISCIGDIMIPHNAMNDLNEKRGKGENIFIGLDDADLIIANLEAPVTDERNYRDNKIYNFKSDKNVLKLFDKRFVFCIANNHIMDYGASGLSDTILELKNNNLEYCGAGKNLKEAAEPVVKVVEGITFGIISCTDERFQPAGNNIPGTLPSKKELVLPVINELKKLSDFIILSNHFGIEYLSIPSKRHIEFADFCLLNGVKIVYYHHAHCVSGMISKSNGVVFYGTGNYLFLKNLKVKKKWLYTGVWQVNVNLNGSITGSNIKPLILNEKGYPESPSKSEEILIKKQIKKISERIELKRFLFIWQIMGILNFSYLKFNLSHYYDIAKRKGIKGSFFIFVEGLKTHFLQR